VYDMTMTNRQHGFSLVELMIAITLGLMLIGGVAQIFLSNKRAYNLQEEMSRLQENARFAAVTLTRDIRLADFWGCHGSVANVTSDLDPGGSNYTNFTTGALSGTEGGSSSDTLILQGAFDTGIEVETPYMPTPSANLQVQAGTDVRAGDIIMVSDCISGDIFQATNTNPNGAKTQIVHNTGVPAILPGNLTGNLSKTYQGDAQIFKVRQISYSIKTGASGAPSLFRNDNGNDQELIDGVEDMQILYGEDTSGDNSANRYVAADDATLNMDNVVSLRITLTLRSEKNNLANSGDGYIRRDFTTTVALRNRIP